MRVRRYRFAVNQSEFAQPPRDGPADDDIVVITEAPVLKALAEKRVTIRKAIQLGVLRFYGAPAMSDAALEWLSNSSDAGNLRLF